MQCKRGIEVVRAMEACLYEKELIVDGTQERDGFPGIVRLEQSLLNLGALPTVCRGLLYLLPVELGDCVVVR